MATCKYSDWTRGQVEALLNIVGEENARNLLAGKVKVVIEEIVDSILDFVATITVLATAAKFIAKEKLAIGQSGIKYHGDNFKAWFLDKVEESQTETTLRCHRLKKWSRDLPIIAELGGEEKVETTLSVIHQLISQQVNGEAGTLLTNGYANIFYVRDVDGVLRAVNVYWYGVGWRVLANTVENPYRWLDGNQVFSRN